MKRLACSERAETLIDRKISIFYIGTELKYFFQLRKNIFFVIDQKKLRKKYKKMENVKISQ